MTDPVPNIDQDVRAAWNSTAPHSQWIVEIAEDYLIVTDETDRSFRRVPVLVGDSIEFGDPVPVTPGFVEVAASVPVHRVVFASRAESRPDVAATILDTPRPPDPRPPAEPPNPAGPPASEEEPATTPPDEGGVSVPPANAPDQSGSTTSGAEPAAIHETEGVGPVSSNLSADVRTRLGLTDTDDDAAVLAALDELRSKADTAPNPEQVAASSAARDEMKAEISRLSSELADIRAAAATDAKRALFDRVVAEGRIAPADRAGWETRYDRAPDVIAEVLASIAPNTAVPVAASGYTGTGDEQVGSLDDEYAALTAAIDGPYATKEA